VYTIRTHIRLKCDTMPTISGFVSFSPF